MNCGLGRSRSIVSKLRFFFLSCSGLNLAIKALNGFYNDVG